MDGKKNITKLKRQFKRLIKNPFHRRQRRKDKEPVIESSSSSSFSSQQQQQSTSSRPRRIATRILGLHNKLWRRQQTVAVCGCGRPLKAGWNCSNCRLVCPNCQRALGDGEKCSRCYPRSLEEPTSSGVIEEASSSAAAEPTSDKDDLKNQQQH